MVWCILHELFAIPNNVRPKRETLLVADEALVTADEALTIAHEAHSLREETLATFGLKKTRLLSTLRRCLR